MKKLFRNLDFSLGKEQHSLLKQKGDGIKARHIPELLRFINEVEQRNKLFIWGFEEPENSLDLRAATKEAHRFRELSSRGDTQVFITSHSPAFYLADVDGHGETRVSRFFVKKQQGSSPKDVLPSDAITAIDTLDAAENAMEDAGLLHLPFVIQKTKELEDSIALERDKAARAQSEAEQLRQDLQALTKPTLFVEGAHDVQLFTSSLQRLESNDAILVRELGGTPNNPEALLNAMMNGGGINANSRVFFLFDNDKSGRRACKSVCGRGDAQTGPVKINDSACAWVLPLSAEYEDFLGEWNLQHSSSSFTAEFLFPAAAAAKIYQTIRDGCENPPEQNVHGDIWNAVMNDQERSQRIYSADVKSIDWFFSRGVHADFKRAFAEGVQDAKLNTQFLDDITSNISSFLIDD